MTDPCSVDGCEKRRKSRLYCSMHAERLRTTGSIGSAEPMNLRGQLGATCHIAGCEKPRKKSGNRYCPMHAARNERHGDPDQVRTARPRYVTSHGYVNIYEPTHPLADPRLGYVYEHRKVLYDAIGPHDTDCAWCRTRISWRNSGGGVQRLEVDHFNADRQDNHPANLLPSCHPCNIARVEPYEFHIDGSPRRKAS